MQKASTLAAPSLAMSSGLVVSTRATRAATPGGVARVRGRACVSVRVHVRVCGNLCTFFCCNCPAKKDNKD
jgi:hypothetical protein